MVLFNYRTLTMSLAENLPVQRIGIRFSNDVMPIFLITLGKMCCCYKYLEVIDIAITISTHVITYPLKCRQHAVNFIDKQPLTFTKTAARCAVGIATIIS